MLGLGKTATGSVACGREIYQRYAVALYRQALLDLDDPASARHVGCDALVNECALAAIPDRGEDDARYRLAESVFRGSRQLAAVLRKLTTSPAAGVEDSDQV
jgi:hypothetical protein